MSTAMVSKSPFVVPYIQYIRQALRPGDVNNRTQLFLKITFTRFSYIATLYIVTIKQDTSLVLVTIFTQE